MKRSAGPGLTEELDRLERMVDDAVSLINRLRAENRELSRRLAEGERAKKTAVRRLDVLLERIEEAT
ncbi:MAG TPA: hypothetical protein ENN51_07960 [candidate division WOR-3 bacterium]|uniref:Cell division protein ZapB n=1 Tax=candidate division WOR-3 bacterium TaxID=2052148 RepID=A0A7V0T6Q0_UNCW3|nr:hypothetical protein [candidate division WOR-3 bacterium]